MIKPGRRYLAGYCKTEKGLKMEIVKRGERKFEEVLGVVAEELNKAGLDVTTSELAEEVESVEINLEA